MKKKVVVYNKLSMAKTIRKHVVINSGELSYDVYIRTTPSQWMGTKEKCILPISIRSKIYQQNGHLKIQGLISCLKTQVNVTLLLCDWAHIHTTSLMYENREELTFEIIKREAMDLVVKFGTCLDNCSLCSWQELICKNEEYTVIKQELMKNYDHDIQFKTLIEEEAGKSYTAERRMVFLDYGQYLEKQCLDLIEHCCYVVIVYRLGYKFEFYHCKQPKYVLYLEKFYPELVGFVRVEVSLGTPKLI